MKKFIFFLLLIFAANSLFPVKLATLREVYRPGLITVHKDKVFITEGTNVYIYSSKTFKLIKKFGKKGEGPQEFKNYALLYARPDHIVVNSTGKVSIFSREGEFIREFRAPYSVGFHQPIGKYYVALGWDMVKKTQYVVFSLYHSSDFKKFKELYRHRYFLQDGKSIDPANKRDPLFWVADKKVFIDDAVNGLIHMFDENGNKLLSITADYKKIEITRADQKKILNYYKNHIWYKNYYEEYRHRVSFSKYFPIIRHFNVSGKTVYVMTYKKEGNKSEFYLFDFQGKLLKKTMVPVIEANVFEFYPLWIENGKLYQVIENENSEEWELHMEDIQ